MKTAGELRAEAARLRILAQDTTDPRALAEIKLLIAEYEQRARLMDNGGATE